MIVTIDTNVLVQALFNNKGASYFILNLVYERKINLALSLPVFCEYEDVLNRDRILKLIGLNQLEISDVLTLIFYFSEKHKIFFLFRPNLKDEKDNIFIEFLRSDLHRSPLLMMEVHHHGFEFISQSSH